MCTSVRVQELTGLLPAREQSAAQTTERGKKSHPWACSKLLLLCAIVDAMLVFVYSENLHFCSEKGTYYACSLHAPREKKRKSHQLKTWRSVWKRRENRKLKPKTLLNHLLLTERKLSIVLLYHVRAARRTLVYSDSVAYFTQPL